MAISNRQRLAELLDDHSDAEIIDWATQVGYERVLEQAFAALQKAFRPDIAVDQDVVVRWDIITPAGTSSYQMNVEAGTCHVTPGVPSSPWVMLGVDLPDFLRLVAGRIDWMPAFMAGTLRLSGDLLLAKNLQHWFG